MPVKHPFVSAIADSGDATKLRPSNWNASHEFSGGANGGLLVRDSTQADGFNWSTTYVGPYAVGGATSTLYQFSLLGTFDPSATAGAAFSIGSTLTLAAGEDAYGLRVAPTFTEAASGVHALLAAVHIAPIITAGVATATTVAGLSLATFAAAAGTTNAAGIYVAAAPTGATNNYALLVDSGDVRFDGRALFALAASGIGPAITGSTSVMTFHSGTSHFEWINQANSVERMRLTDAGILALGTTITTSGGAGHFILANNTGQLRAVNAAGTDTLSILQLNASDQLVLGSQAVDLKWGRALVALGGGAAPTFGTIGGAGPATAAQNAWMRVIDSTGAAFWVPAWK